MCRIIILNATKSKDFFPAVYCNISSATHSRSKKETAVKSYGLPTSAVQVAKASNNLKKKKKKIVSYCTSIHQAWRDLGAE